MNLVAEDVRTSESRNELKREFHDEEYRYAYAEELLNTWVAAQIVILREQRGMSQTRLGELIGTKQPGVSRLEDVNHSTWKTETLKKVARALGVRLKITFETFGTLLEEDEQFSRSFLERVAFEDDPEFEESSGDKTPVVAASRIVHGAHVPLKFESTSNGRPIFRWPTPPPASGEQLLAA